MESRMAVDTRPSWARPGTSAEVRSGEAERRRPRPWLRTVVIAFLLSVIPVVGTGMAAVYVYARRPRARYDGGAAFRAAALSFLVTLLGVVALVVLWNVGWAWLG